MKKISVSIVYAHKDQQWIQEVDVLRGSSAADVLEQSAFTQSIPNLAEVSHSELKLGVYAQPVDADYLMEEGDRLEIYRPLSADPKEVRRQLALLGKTMGKGIEG